MNDEISERLTLACAAARTAGQHTLRYFLRDDLQIDLKHDSTPVTIADREAEELIRTQIARAFPCDGILGEELGERPGTSGWRWIIDPIDGTKSFIHGVPLYAVLIGIDFQNQSRIGVIHLPALDQTVYAATGQGAWQDRAGQLRQPVHVSKKQSLSEGLFLTSGVSGFHKRGAWPAFERLTKTAKLMRTWGDAFGYMLVATGQAEAMVDPQMSIWDAAALLPILQEAGGTFTDWQGRTSISAGEGIATNGLVLNEVLGLLRG
jgi:histidinol phosphatase-like enzyme (inositol monophosphatase family)